MAGASSKQSAGTILVAYTQASLDKVDDRVGI
jgi:hypothetical protein